MPNEVPASSLFYLPISTVYNLTITRRSSSISRLALCLHDGEKIVSDTNNLAKWTLSADQVIGKIINDYNRPIPIVLTAYYSIDYSREREIRKFVLQRVTEESKSTGESPPRRDKNVDTDN